MVRIAPDIIVRARILLVVADGRALSPLQFHFNFVLLIAFYVVLVTLVAFELSRHVGLANAFAHGAFL